MSSIIGRGRRGLVATIVVCGLATYLYAQAPTVRPGGSAMDPIRCWWKADKDAVLVGEQFTLTLTCAVLETNPTKVVTDAKQFDPAALQIKPFELLGGTRHGDIESPPWRYFQYDYNARLFGEGFFGQDVDIPATKITYTIQSATSGGTQSRDETIVLPALPVRVLSIVPKTTTNIRDVSDETFAAIEARSARATGALTAAGILFGFAVVLVGLAGLHTIAGYRERARPLPHPLPMAAILRGCLHAIDRLRAEVARDGWTSESASRAMAVLRVAGAVALGRPVTQSVVDTGATGQTGQFIVRSGIFGRKHSLVSASTTADAINRRFADGAPVNSRAQATLEEIREALLTFNAVHYGRNGELHVSELNASLERAADALRGLRLAALWPVRATSKLAKSAGIRRAAAWSR
jgi:hypothetical protein